LVCVHWLVCLGGRNVSDLVTYPVTTTSIVATSTASRVLFLAATTLARRPTTTHASSSPPKKTAGTPTKTTGTTTTGGGRRTTGKGYSRESYSGYSTCSRGLFCLYVCLLFSLLNKLPLLACRMVESRSGWQRLCCQEGIGRFAAGVQCS
jgi:hypothetical protein